MRAAVLATFGEDLVIESVTALAPGPRDVVIEVGASGICHTDLSVRNGLFKGVIDGAMIGGHEGAGRVVEVGSQVSRVKVGDRVITSFRPACGVCRQCVNGRTHLCEALGRMLMAPRATRLNGETAVAMSGLGTFAETMVCDEASVVPVRSDLPDSDLALLGCGMTTGVGAALNTAKVRPGSTVVVVGCGGVGQSVIQGAVVAGAARIIAVDPVAKKREIALALGATDVVDPAAGPPDEQVRELTGGFGVEYVFDVVGIQEVVASSFRMLDKAGLLVLVGYGPMDGSLTFPAFSLQSEEKRITGCVAGSSQVRSDFQRYVDLIERGRLNTSALVSETIGLEGVNLAMARMGSGDLIRTVITRF